jgi:hypothetical protein
MTTEQLIQKYPKIFQQYEGNPGMVNWYGVPKGWLDIIDKLCGAIQEYVNSTTRYTKDGPIKPIQPTLTQMKEKFGGLRFYMDNSDDYIEGMIRMAEYMCDNTCQDCGSEQDLGLTKGWISVLCRTCAIGNGDRAMNNWEPKNKES